MKNLRQFLSDKNKPIKKGKKWFKQDNEWYSFLLGYLRCLCFSHQVHNKYLNQVDGVSGDCIKYFSIRLLVPLHTVQMVVIKSCAVAFGWDWMFCIAKDSRATNLRNSVRWSPVDCWMDLFVFDTKSPNSVSAVHSTSPLEIHGFAFVNNLIVFWRFSLISGLTWFDSSVASLSNWSIQAKKIEIKNCPDVCYNLQILFF